MEKSRSWHPFSPQTISGEGSSSILKAVYCFNESRTVTTRACAPTALCVFSVPKNAKGVFGRVRIKYNGGIFSVVTALPKPSVRFVTASIPYLTLR